MNNRGQPNKLNYLDALALIFIGPRVFLDAVDEAHTLVSLAGTLVHEDYHTQQSVFLKTLSFWSGIVTGTNPMARYEWPAYREQVRFLRALAVSRTEYAEIAGHEILSILESVKTHYGKPPFDL